MADQMTKADWDLKDRRIVRQSMLKAAVELTKDKEEVDADGVMALAECFVDWVYEVPTRVYEVKMAVKKEKKDDIVLPTPTVAQEKALEMVERQTSWTKGQVFRKFGKYPTADNVNACIKLIVNPENH